MHRFSRRCNGAGSRATSRRYIMASSTALCDDRGEVVVVLRLQRAMDHAGETGLGGRCLRGVANEVRCFPIAEDAYG